MRLLFYILSVLITGTMRLAGHGFGSQTYVKVSDIIPKHIQSIHQCAHQKIEGYKTIEQLYDYMRISKNIRTFCYNPDLHTTTEQKIKVAGISKTDCYVRIGFSSSPANYITCAPIQEFYHIQQASWVPAYQLHTGDVLLSEGAVGKKITSLTFIKEPLRLYALEIEKEHTFFVGFDSILTHNMYIPVDLFISIGCSFGEGAVAGGTAGSFFGPVTIGAGMVVGGILAATVNYFAKDTTKAEYTIDVSAEGFEEYIQAHGNMEIVWSADAKDTKKDEQKRKDVEREKAGAQAPGMPTEKDGYIPPKNWDGKKVKNPHGSGFGWPDKDGWIWVPTGSGPLAHGGPHWDVQHPTIRSRYRNVAPGGKEI